jgi:hypothetical protein
VKEMYKLVGGLGRGERRARRHGMVIPSKNKGGKLQGAAILACHF